MRATLPVEAKKRSSVIALRSSCSFLSVSLSKSPRCSVEAMSPAVRAGRLQPPGLSLKHWLCTTIRVLQRLQK